MLYSNEAGLIYTSVLSDKTTILVDTQKTLNDYKIKFTEIYNTFRDIYASLFDTNTVEEDIKSYINDQNRELIAIKEQYALYCEQLMNIDLVDDIEKGNTIQLNTVPIIQLEIENIKQIYSNIIVLVREMRKKAKTMNNNSNIEKEKEKETKHLSYYS